MEFRLVRKHEHKAAAQLAEKVFCNDGEHVMERSFPTLFQPGVSHSYAAFNDQGELVSFIGMVPLIIQSGDSCLYAYSIGAVCTDPAYRGQGIAGRLFALCQQHAKTSGASLMFISGDRSLYTRAGSMAFGKSRRYIIEAKDAEQLETPSTSWTISELHPQDLFAVHHLLLQKSAAIQWSITDLAQFIGAAPMASIHKMDQYIQVARTPEQDIVAVAVFAIPKPHYPEQVGMLIEYAGNPSAVTALISQSLSHFELSSLSVALPWQDIELANILEAVDIKVEQLHNEGTVLVVDGTALIKQAGYDISANTRTAISVLPDGHYELHTPTGSAVIGGNPELVSLLFHPDSTVAHPEDAKIQTLALPYMYGLYFI